MHERLCRAQQPVGLDDRVGGDHAHQRGAGEAQPGVGGVCLAAVFLVDDQQVGEPPRGIGLADLCLLQLRHLRALAWIHVEGSDEPPHGVVFRPVIDDDYLMLRIFQRQQRLHAFDDRELFVVGRRDHGDGQRKVRVALPQLARALAGFDPGGKHPGRDQQLGKADHVPQEHDDEAEECHRDDGIACHVLNHGPAHAQLLRSGAGLRASGGRAVVS